MAPWDLRRGAERDGVAGRFPRLNESLTSHKSKFGYVRSRGIPLLSLARRLHVRKLLVPGTALNLRVVLSKVASATDVKSKWEELY